MWRVPFLLSIFLLAISVWIRLTLNELPLFRRMKEEGRASKAPLSEAFTTWRHLRLVILALLGLTAGQAVVWYTGQFYALFFLTQTLKVDPFWAQIMIALSLVIGTPFFIVFGWLSDKIGRKPIIMLGCLLAVLTYYPAGILKHIPGGNAIQLSRHLRTPDALRQSRAGRGDRADAGDGRRRSRPVPPAVRSGRQVEVHRAVRRGEGRARQSRRALQQ